MKIWMGLMGLKIRADLTSGNRRTAGLPAARHRPLSLMMFIILMNLMVGGARAADPQLKLDPGDATDFDPLGGLGDEDGQEVEITAVIEPGTDGRPDVLAVTATLEKSWHLYSITQKPGGPLATRITVATDSPRQTAGSFVPDPPPHVRAVDDVPAWKGLPIEEHADRVTWRAPLAAGTGAVQGSVRVQLCQDTSCLPPRSLPFRAEASPVGSAEPPSPQAAFRHVAERTHAAIEAEFGPPRLVAGVASRPLRLKLVPEKGWHLYRPADSAATEIGQGKPTIASMVGPSADRLIGLSATEVTLAGGPELAEAGAVEGPVTLEFLLADGAEPVEAVLGFQTCTESTCDPPTAVRLTIVLPTATEPGGVEYAAAKYGEAARDPAPLRLATTPAPAARAAISCMIAIRVRLPPYAPVPHQPVWMVHSDASPLHAFASQTAA